MKYSRLTREEKTRLCRLEIRVHLDAYNLADHVKTVVRSFDGKVFTKRFETALRLIDRHLYVETPFNSFNIKYVAHEYPERSITTSDGSTEYIDNNECYIAGLCKESSDDHRALTDDNRIIADNIIKDIERMKEYNKRTYNETESQLSKIMQFDLQKKRIQEEAEKHNNEVCYMVRRYFDLDIHIQR